MHSFAARPATNLADSRPECMASPQRVHSLSSLVRGPTRATHASQTCAPESATTGPPQTRQSVGNKPFTRSAEAMLPQLRSTRLTARQPDAAPREVPGGPPFPSWTSFTLALLKTTFLVVRQKEAPAGPMVAVYLRWLSTAISTGNQRRLHGLQFGRGLPYSTLAAVY